MKFKKFATSMFVISLIVIAFAAPTIVSAMSAPVGVESVELLAPQISAPQEQEADLPNLSDLVKTAGNLGGFALLFAAVINIGKTVRPNLFPNGSSPKYNLVFETLLLIGLVTAQLTGKADLVPIFDNQAGLIANGITGIFAIFYQLYISRIGHENVLAGFPLIGKSYSNRIAGSKFGELIVDQEVFPAATPRG